MTRQLRDVGAHPVRWRASGGQLQPLHACWISELVRTAIPELAGWQLAVGDVLVERPVGVRLDLLTPERPLKKNRTWSGERVAVVAVAGAEGERPYKLLFRRPTKTPSTLVIEKIGRRLRRALRTDDLATLAERDLPEMVEASASLQDPELALAFAPLVGLAAAENSLRLATDPTERARHKAQADACRVMLLSQHIDSASRKKGVGAKNSGLGNGPTAAAEEAWRKTGRAIAFRLWSEDREIPPEHIVTEILEQRDTKGGIAPPKERGRIQEQVESWIGEFWIDTFPS